MKGRKAYTSVIRTSVFEEKVVKVDASRLEDLCGNLIIELKNGEVKTLKGYHSPKAYLIDYGFILLQN